uniref:Terpene synthase metal-binding domain-containing protein n=1 Tax=Hordeum vulgare subsp. vulgare TaxID=112509 RepID=A0A8I6XBK7_HORVV
MERWSEQAAENLPANLKELYINILNTTNDIEEELKRHKNKNAEMIKELLIHMAKCYHAEVKWRDEHYIPTSVEEHLQISVRSSACMQITIFVFISLGDVTTREVLEWVLTYPKIIRSVCIVGRIGNDMVSHERVQITQHVVSTVQTSTKEHGITIGEANDKLKVIIEEAWMDIVHECLHKNQPMVLLEKATDLARTMDFMYKREDAFTLPSNLKETLTSLYVNYI